MKKPGLRMKKPGLRIIKTGLAVMISMVISHIRPGGGLPFYSAIAAIISMQQNVDDSFSVGVNRVIGTIFGGLMGLIYLVIVPDGSIPVFLDYFLIALVVTFIIWVMANVNRKSAVSIAAIVFLSITINHSKDPGGIPLDFASSRVTDTLIGVLSAILVNYGHFELKKRIEKSR